MFRICQQENLHIFTYEIVCEPYYSTVWSIYYFADTHTSQHVHIHKRTSMHTRTNKHTTCINAHSEGNMLHCLIATHTVDSSVSSVSPSPHFGCPVHHNVLHHKCIRVEVLQEHKENIHHLTTVPIGGLICDILLHNHASSNVIITVGKSCLQHKP